MTFFRKSYKSEEAQRTAAKTNNKPTVPDYLAGLINYFNELWLAPDEDQFRHSYNGYQTALYAPLEAAQNKIDELEGRAIRCVEKVVEIAPDLARQVLRQHPLTTEYYIEHKGDV